jgi:hypothetical protein
MLGPTFELYRRRLLAVQCHLPLCGTRVLTPHRSADAAGSGRAPGLEALLFAKHFSRRPLVILPAAFLIAGPEWPRPGQSKISISTRPAPVTIGTPLVISAKPIFDEGTLQIRKASLLTLVTVIRRPLRIGATRRGRGIDRVANA